jgi:hypothetical protein
MGCASSRRNEATGVAPGTARRGVRRTSSRAPDGRGRGSDPPPRRQGTQDAHRPVGRSRFARASGARRRLDIAVTLWNGGASSRLGSRPPVVVRPGRLVRLRIAEVDNLFLFNVGVDAVSVTGDNAPGRSRSSAHRRRTRRSRLRRSRTCGTRNQGPGRRIPGRATGLTVRWQELPHPVLTLRFRGGPILLRRSLPR